MISQLRLALALLLVAVATTYTFAQQPKPTPPEKDKDQDERVKVFTEEVRLPIVAFDAYGHYDPTLELDDILVLEDGVAQQLRSLRHIAGSVLFVLDTGGDSTGMGGMAKSTSLTRQVASELVAKLQNGTAIAVMQSGNAVFL